MYLMMMIIVIIDNKYLTPVVWYQHYTNEIKPTEPKDTTS